MLNSGVYSCTSNGVLRLTKPGENGAEPSSSLAALPMRLCEWRLSSDSKSFAYGGDEVELSLWDTEKAFSLNPRRPHHKMLLPIPKSGNGATSCSPESCGGQKMYAKSL